MTTTPRKRKNSLGIGYREILSTLLEEIRDGTWKVGEPFVTEGELTKRFATTRTTVRQALQELATLGYIKRRRGSRSMLMTSDPSCDFVNSVRSISELLHYAHRTNSKLVNVEKGTAGKQLADRLDVEVGSAWTCIEIVRKPLHGGLPIGFSRIYCSGKFEGLEQHLGDSCIVYNILEVEYGVVFRRVKRQIEAMAASADVAARLKLKEGSPVLAIKTIFVEGGENVIEIGLAYFPANRFRLEMVLERGPGQWDRLNELSSG